MLAHLRRRRLAAHANCVSNCGPFAAPIPCLTIPDLSSRAKVAVAAAVEGSAVVFRHRTIKDWVPQVAFETWEYGSTRAP
jgi:hypothetical protein